MLAVMPVVATTSAALAAHAAPVSTVGTIDLTQVTSLFQNARFVSQPSQPAQAGRLNALLIDAPPLNGFIPKFVVGLTDQRRFAQETVGFADRSSGPGGFTLPVSSPGAPYYFVATLDSGAQTHIFTYDDAQHFDLPGANRDGTEQIDVQGANGIESLDVSDGIGIYATGLQNATGFAGGTISVNTSTLRGQTNMPILTTQQGSVIPNIIGSPMLAHWQVKIENSKTRHINVGSTTFRGPSLTAQALGTSIPAGYSKLTLTTTDNGPPPDPFFINFNGTGSSDPTDPGGWSLLLTHATAKHGTREALNYDYLFDTGAQVSIISHDTASTLGIFDQQLQNPDFQVEVLGVGGIELVPGMYIDNFKITTQGGDFTWDHVPMLVLDVADPRAPDAVIPGIIGMNLFNDRDIILNTDVSTTGGTAVYFGPKITPQWTNTTGGVWSDDTKWSLGSPDGPDVQANFLGSITGAATISVDAGSFTVGSMKFDNANRYTIAGPGTIRMEAFSTGEGAINVVTGSHTISAPMEIVSPTTITVTPSTATLTISGTVNAGSVALTKAGAGATVMNNVRAGTLAVNAGTLSVAPNGTNAGASRVTALSIAGGATPTATLDLNDNDLLITTGTYAAVKDAVAFARHSGAWDRRGLTSTAARNALPKNKTLGVVTGAEYLSTGQSLFDTFAVTSGNVLVKFTYYGDTDLNGKVDFDDYSRTDSGFNIHKTGWFNGDFDYNGQVDFDDYSLIDMSFNTQGNTVLRAMAYLSGDDRSHDGMNTPALRMVEDHFAQFGVPYAASFLNAVPEPGVAMLSVLATMLALPRRRRS
jgi:hypothetical protein